MRVAIAVNITIGQVGAGFLAVRAQQSSRCRLDEARTTQEDASASYMIDYFL